MRDLNIRAILPGLPICFRILTGGEVTGKTGTTAAGKSYHDNEEEVTEKNQRRKKRRIDKPLDIRVDVERHAHNKVKREIIPPIEIIGRSIQPQHANPSI